MDSHRMHKRTQSLDISSFINRENEMAMLFLKVHTNEGPIYLYWCTNRLEVHSGTMSII